VSILKCNVKIAYSFCLIMDLNEILTKERDSLRDENMELRKKINELEISLQKALNLLENDN
jgi:hypothetical protein